MTAFLLGVGLILGLLGYAVAVVWSAGRLASTAWRGGFVSKTPTRTEEPMDEPMDERDAILKRVGYDPVTDTWTADAATQAHIADLVAEIADIDARRARWALEHQKRWEELDAALAEVAKLKADVCPVCRLRASGEAPHVQ